MRSASTAVIVVLVASWGVAATVEPCHAQVPPPAAQVQQGPGRISGQVTDTAGQPLNTVAITLRSAADSAIVTGMLTQRDGRFRLDGLLPGGYLLHVGLMGYRSRSSEVIALTVQSPAVDLGKINLQVLPVELGALSATAERASVVIEADRTVYNTKAMPVASTGSATDVLRAVPELEVDVNNNVKLRGNQAVAIHLNGRPTPLRGEQLANFLQQLPGNRIARVEVLPNPSARHDPEGMGGIVNIVLEENADLGLSGSVSANASTRNRQFLNGRLNYQRGRLTLFTGLGVSMYGDIATSYDLRHNLITQPVTLIEQNSERDQRARGWNMDWTAELRVGRQATLWSNAWLNASRSDMSGTTLYGIMGEDRTVRDRYDRVDASRFGYGNYNLGFGFKQVMQPQRQELTIDGRWSQGTTDTDTRQRRLFQILAGAPADVPLEITLNDIAAGNGNVSVQADYFRPVGKGRLDIGYRAWRRSNDSDNLLRVFESPEAADPRDRSHSGYDFTEAFHSLYTTYAVTRGRFGANIGLRAELADTRFVSGVADASFDRDYNTLFPSINLSYTPKQGRTLRLLYSKRIARPIPYYLDPFVPSTDPLNRLIGNPDLRPSYTQSFSADMSVSGSRGTVRVGPYYRRTTDIWERIRTVDTLGVATSRWENGRSSENYGSSFTVSLRPQGRLSGSTSLSIYRDVRDGTNISSAYRRSATLWSVGGNIGVKMTERTSVQLFGNHFPVQSILQGRASGYTFTSLALRQQLWGTKGSISLNVSDPLNLYRYTSSTTDATYIQTSRSSYRSRVATLGLTYNFGKPPQQQSRRSMGAEEAGETIRVR